MVNWTARRLTNKFIFPVKLDVCRSVVISTRASILQHGAVIGINVVETEMPLTVYTITSLFLLQSPVVVR